MEKELNSEELPDLNNTHEQSEEYFDELILKDFENSMKDFEDLKDDFQKLFQKRKTITFL